ncbi:Tex family protein [Bernardetia sp. ABR2-2B]|uniref:Tex family protein n=1 Tax=Bernardetia sp. ABR2-2B TaxID=3127472 RepID=UPI0030CCA705
MDQALSDAQHIVQIAAELGVRVKQVEATAQLLDEGATVPFISRYRKEVTGTLDEVQVANVRDRLSQLRELDKRREAILKSIDEQDKLTPELEEKINAVQTLSALEDLYLPYKPKRKTRASMAKEKGLEPLALQVLEQGRLDLEKTAKQFVDEEKGVKTLEEALAGARDIIAEHINEHAETRAQLRTIFEKEGKISARVITGKEKEGEKYRDYFEWEEPLVEAPSHRVLALRRAEKEGILLLDVQPSEERAITLLEDKFVHSNTKSSEQVQIAAKDAYKRLLKPSMETEIRMLSKQRADQEAITIFAENLRQLLLSAPLGQKSTLALDPGFRTGCKLVVLDKQGKLVYNDTVYPNEPQKETLKAGNIILALAEKYNIEAIAIGNGTASRETERFIKSIPNLPKTIQIVVVSESGASIYSASEVAREEFAEYDLTVRGAVSIGRRLMDPLAELVKLDPKSIGVGQYQHDVDQKQLKNSLDDTVMSCVNAVGVEVNTASKELLSYVSGLGASLAKNIVTFRNENGAFTSRAQLKKVPRLGDKAYEQAAGFLRIRDAKNLLDASAVHPESYPIVEKMAKDVGTSVEELIKNEELRKKINLKNYVTDTVGLPTLEDIVSELAKPGRDPREQFESFSFEEGVEKMEDLKVGMKLSGIVTNITDFGAFIDVGVHQDGLAHISQLSDKFINHPTDAVKVHQKVEVTVMDVDLGRKRISLSLKAEPFGGNPPKTGGSSNTSSETKSQRPQRVATRKPITKVEKEAISKLGKERKNDSKFTRGSSLSEEDQTQTERPKRKSSYKKADSFVKRQEKQKEEEQETGGTMEDKLAALRNKFGK